LDISTGYEYEKKALELVGEKPRRAKKWCIIRS
jgi:hypothetical protein